MPQHHAGNNTGNSTSGGPSTSSSSSASSSTSGSDDLVVFPRVHTAMEHRLCAAGTVPICKGLAELQRSRVYVVIPPLEAGG